MYNSITDTRSGLRHVPLEERVADRPDLAAALEAEGAREARGVAADASAAGLRSEAQGRKPAVFEAPELEVVVGAKHDLHHVSLGRNGAPVGELHDLLAGPGLPHRAPEVDDLVLQVGLQGLLLHVGDLGDRRGAALPRRGQAQPQEEPPHQPRPDGVPRTPAEPGALLGEGDMPGGPHHAQVLGGARHLRPGRPAALESLSRNGYGYCMLF